MTYANKIISDSTEINNLLSAHDNFVKSKNYNLALTCLDDIKKINKKIPNIDLNYSKVYFNIGHDNFKYKKYDTAIHFFNISKNYLIDHNHDILIDIYLNIGSCYQKLGKYNEAKLVYEKLLRLDNCPAIVYGLLAYSKLCLGDILDLNNIKNKINDNLNKGLLSLTPFTSILITDSPQYQYLTSKIFSASFLNKRNKAYLYSQNKLHDKIKVAYLSSDFYNHATSHLIAGIFENQNHQDFEYYAISYGKVDDSDISKRVRNSFKDFISVNNKSEDEISKLLVQLEIDIAIDLKGHTQNNRLNILSSRPCPIQLSYLGFPGTLGTDFIDYLIFDQYVVNAKNRNYFNENIIFLPNSYQCNEEKKLINVSKKDSGLPENKFILCSLNNSRKYNIELLDCWSNILLKNPDTILWLLNDKKEIKDKLLSYFTSKNIKSHRIIFANKIDNQKHISRLSLADLYLDSYPCNAHTSASDALQANLPIVTLSGRSMSSRVTGSLLNSLDLQELITDNFYNYEKKINQLIRNKDQLKMIKMKITKNKTNIFNAKNFVYNLEKAYKIIWNNFKNGKKIADIYL